MKHIPFLVLLASLGCSSSTSPPPPNSNELPLDQIQLNVSVSSNGEAALVIAHLSTSSNYLVYLGEGDRLFARAGSVSGQLVPFGNSRAILLSTSSSTIDVVLERGSTSGVAHVSLPAAFGLAAPIELPRRTPLTVWWGPTDGSGKAPSLRVEGECVAVVVRTPSADTGAYTFDPADFVPRSTSPCIASLTANRTVYGVRPTVEGLAGSTATTIQTRTVFLRMNP